MQTALTRRLGRVHPDAAMPAETATYLAVLRVHRRDGRATIDTVAAERGITRSTTFRQLCALRDLGLVGMDEAKRGVLRPLYAPLEPSC